MASPTDKTYFPPLEECLTGKTTLISWELVAAALSDSSSDRLLSPAIANFLKDPFVHQLIKTPSRVFEPRTAASTNDFNVKTSAIHITPTANQSFDIKQIKDDASWLSTSLRINEVAALRVVVLEFQSRAQRHLAGALSTQDIANIEDAAGVGNAQASSFLSALNLSSASDDEAILADFETEHQRHQRLLVVYLSERRHFMAAVSFLVTFLLQTLRSFMSHEALALRDGILRDFFAIGDQNNVYIASFEALLPPYMELLQNCTEQSQRMCAAFERSADITPELRSNWTSTYLTEAMHAMTVIYQVVDLTNKSRLFAPQEIVSQWFKFVLSHGALEQFVGPSELLLPARALLCVISLAILHLDRALAYLDGEIELGENEDPYLDSPSILGDMHETMWMAAEEESSTSMPFIFAWSLILRKLYVGYQERAEKRDLAQNQRAQAGFELENQRPTSGRRNSAGSIVSIEQSPYDLFLISANLDREIEPIETLALAATDGGQVYELMAEMAIYMGNSQDAAFHPVVGARMRMVFLELLKQSYFLVGYKSESLTCLVRVLSAEQQYWDLSESNPLLSSQSVAASALKDNILMEDYVGQSLSRYPYEFCPFVTLCRILSTCVGNEENTEFVTNLLLRTPSLTFELPSNWEAFEWVHGEDNVNVFQLKDDLFLFPPSALWKQQLSDGEPFCIPAGTRGRFLSDNQTVALFQYEHSALALLGKRLEVNLVRDAYDVVLPLLEPGDLVEGISLIATLLRAQSLKSSGPLSTAALEAGLQILQEASEALSRTKDIISVACDTLDALIHENTSGFNAESMAVLSACLEFLHATLPFCPGRVWSYMARCELLNGDSKSGRLSMITGSLDLTCERFNLVSSALQLYSSLVDNAMTSSVQRKIESIPQSRQNDGGNGWLGSSDKILSQVCLSVAQAAVDILENSMTWRFQSEVHRGVVTREVVKIMDNLVLYAFSIGDTDSGKRLTGCLVPGANYIVESFLSPQLGSLRFQPLLATVLVALKAPDSTLYQRRVQLVSERLVTVLSFMTTLLRVAVYLDKSTIVIRNRIFQSVSTIVRLCAVRDCYRVPAYSLLRALVESTGKSGKEPPSLLGYLRPSIARSFIQLVSRLDSPFDREYEVVNTWKFLSAVLQHRQQWMAHCLLSGRTPREALLKYERITRVSPDSVLAVALEKIKSLGSMPSSEALAVLDFFTSAQNYWPWTIFAMHSDKEVSFLDDFRGYVRSLKSTPVILKSNAKEAASQARIAAYIAEVFAMQLFHLRQMSQDNGFAKDLINDLDYFLREGVQVSGYNVSLHANFAKNFASRYAGCSLDELKRTTLKRHDLGPQYFYAIDFAEAMLSFDGSWLGARQNGFRHEMERANLNLSLVDAQVALFKAWEYLLLELGVCLLPKNKTIAKQMLQVAQKCLESNQTSQGPEKIFVGLAHSRANLALTLLQRLAERSMLPKDMSRMLAAIWNAISIVENPFGQEQLTYYRTLLKILYIVLRSARHCANSDPAVKPATADGSVGVTQLVLSIVDRVVASGFRTLVTLVHDSDSSTSPEDISLITAVLQASMSLPDMDQCQTQVMNIMASHDVFRMAASLFSWADKLAENGDPVYGELALLFLLEISSFPVIAEQLACEGLLGHITTSSLAGFMRRPNVGPYAENMGAARCYSIWAKGLLPLLINVLGPLGATIAPEVAFVLNQFPNLLRSSVERFEPPGLSRTTDRYTPQFVTLLSVSEVHSLALLTRALAEMRVNNTRDISEVVWDGGAPLLENIEFWLTSRKVLRERILPLGPVEISWRTTKAAEGSQCETKLEQKVVAGLKAVQAVLSEQDED